MSENQQKSKLPVIIAIIAACLIIYSQTIYFDFINIDDRAYIYENRALLNGFNWKTVSWAFTAFYSANWHPLTWLSHFLDFALFGLNAGGHHATNVVFHTTNAILAFVVFRKMTGDFWKSAIVSLLFAVHLAHVESVAWVAERKDVLSTMFWLLTMLAYFRHCDEATKRQSDKIPPSLSRFVSPSYILTILFFAAGLMSKPMLVTLPFVLLLCDFWALERWKLFDLKCFGLLVAEKIPLFLLSAISAYITFVAQKSFGAAVSLQTLPLETRFVNIALSYAKYVVMLFYPVNLGFWYPFEPNVNPLEVIGAIILLLVISVFCWRERKRRKYLLMGWLWFLGTLVPVIGLVQVGLQSLADRYTYIPYFGLFIMLVWGASDLFAIGSKSLHVSKGANDGKNHAHINVQASATKTKIVVAVCAIALIIFGALAFQQTSRWRNSETLYTHTLSFTKNNYFLMTNLCLHYLNKASPEIAEPRCTELLEATPPSPESNNLLGYLRTETGKYDQAVNNYQAAIRMRPDWGILYANLSDTFTRQGKPDEADKSLQKALTMKDASLSNEILARSSNNLGASYLQKNRTEKAVEYFTKALELNPDLAEANENLKKAKGEK